MARANVKRDDVVVVISGEHKGKAGKVLSVDLDKQRVIVEGINLRKSAVRRSQDNPQGGITEKEAPLHLSNVMLQTKYDSRRAAGRAAEAEK